MMMEASGWWFVMTDLWEVRDTMDPPEWWLGKAKAEACFRPLWSSLGS